MLADARCSGWLPRRWSSRLAERHLARHCEFAKWRDFSVHRKVKEPGHQVTGALAAIPPVSAPDIPIGGKVDGDEISFSAVREIQGKSVKFNLSSMLAGDELKIHIV